MPTKRATAGAGKARPRDTEAEQVAALDIPRLRELSAKATKRPWFAGVDVHSRARPANAHTDHVYTETAGCIAKMDGDVAARYDNERFITALANSADALLALAARAEAMEPPNFQMGQKVRVDHKRFKGIGTVDRMEVCGEWHHVGWCPTRGWLVPVKLENGNTWWYEAATVTALESTKP